MLDSVFQYVIKWLRFLEGIVYELILLPKLSANEILSHMKTYKLVLADMIDAKTRSVRKTYSPIFMIVAIPWRVWYYYNVTLPLLFLSFIRRNVALIVDVIFRKNTQSRRIFLHISALQDILYSMWRTIIDTKLSDLVAWFIQAILDVSIAW